ncbi:MAG: hypothetical protein ACYTG0_23725, partial [Planctomycetota bacterium]
MGILLLVTVFLPLVGAALAFGDRSRVRRTALWTTVLTFVFAAVLIAQHVPGQVDLIIPSEGPAASDGGVTVDVRFHIGLDGLSLWFFGLTALLMIVAVLVSWEAIRDRFTAYYRLLLFLE